MQFEKVLNDAEIAQLQAMADRISRTSGDKRGSALRMHHAVQDAISGLICVGQGNPSCAVDFTDLGKKIRGAVIKS